MCLLYPTILVGGCADPILIGQIDDVIPRVKAYVASKCPFEFDLKFTTYGQDGALDIIGNHSSNNGKALSRSKHQPATIGILGQARASTQRQANLVVATARVACVHGAYKGQKANSGNFGMPTAPHTIEMGPVSEFTIYHLMTIEDPTVYFPFELHTASGSGECQGVGPDAGDIAVPSKGKPNGSVSETDPTKPSSTAAAVFAFESNKLGALASVIRSKNSGPYEITMDVMFDESTLYDRVKSSGVLSKSTIARLYDIDEFKIEVAMWWDPALAFKITIVRPMVSGSWGEIDVHSSCQHVPLMHLDVPLSTT